MPASPVSFVTTLVAYISREQLESSGISAPIKDDHRVLWRLRVISVVSQTKSRKVVYSPPNPVLLLTIAFLNSSEVVPSNMV